MKYIKLILASILVTASLSVAFVGTVVAQGYETPQIKNSLCQGSELQTGTGECADITEGSGDGVNNIVSTIINIFSWIVGVVCVIMIIYGGFRYVTAGGDSGNVTKAKDTILYAIIGLVIVALAQVIVKFILQKVTSASE